MLSSLFGSESKAKILNLLVFDPEKKYKLRELSKELGLSAASARKELSALTEFGLLKNEDDAWWVNKNFIIFSEIKALLMKAQILSSQKFIDGLKKISDLKYLALSGVFTSDEEAKTDIIIVGKIKRKPFLNLINVLQGDLGREINYTIMDEAEFFYRQEVMDIFLYNALSGKNIVLIDNLTALKK
ncbi:MAG: hypothetical protein HY931_01205 [Candidatus Falkowbacteria bacterium]|nr:MAG: hypothetical protein HY931_01205 [Candidatus Falkowbacteria bacterium]